MDLYDTGEGLPAVREVLTMKRCCQFVEDYRYITCAVFWLVKTKGDKANTQPYIQFFSSTFVGVIRQFINRFD